MRKRQLLVLSVLALVVAGLVVLGRGRSGGAGRVEADEETVASGGDDIVDATATGGGPGGLDRAEIAEVAGLSIADVLEGVDLSDPVERGRVAGEIKAIETRRREAGLARARELGLPERIERPDGTIQEVAGIDENGRVIYFTTHNLNAGISSGASVLMVSPYSLSGNGVVVGMWDGGSGRSSHQEFGGRLTVKDGSSTNDHATHVGGTMAASGVSGNAKGMATAATIDSYDWNSDKSEMTSRGASSANESGAILLSNHSYGYVGGWNYVAGGSPYRMWEWNGSGSNAAAIEQNFGRYNTYARDTDSLAYAAPYYLMFRSAGNERANNPSNGDAVSLSAGGSTVTTYNSANHPPGDGQYRSGFENISFDALAKNVVTVGAVTDAVSFGSRSSGLASATSFSSFGPTDDGRIKPDLVANGDGIYSSTSASDTSYGTKSGTSMASPSAAGTAALLVQEYRRLFPGGDMLSSTLRGLLIHTADDLGNAGPDYKYGWGLINGQAAADIIRDHEASPDKKRITEATLTTSTQTIHHDIIWDGSSAIKATLCWTDPAGSSTTTSDLRSARLKNDLNITITAPDNSEHLPFVMPFVGNWTVSSMDEAATRGVNTTDNVEQVLIETPPEAGQYRITVSYTGTLTNREQTYSLIVSGSSDESPSNILPTAWHNPSLSETLLSNSTMRNPAYEIGTGSSFTVYTGVRKLNNPGYGEANQTGGTLYYRAGTSGNWTSTSLSWHANNGDYQFWKADVPGAATSGVVQYYIRMTFDSGVASPVYLHGRDSGGYVTSNQTEAQTSPYSVRNRVSWAWHDPDTSGHQTVNGTTATLNAYIGYMAKDGTSYQGASNGTVYYTTDESLPVGGLGSASDNATLTQNFSFIEKQANGSSAGDQMHWQAVVSSLPLGRTVKYRVGFWNSATDEEVFLPAASDESFQFSTGPPSPPSPTSANVGTTSFTTAWSAVGGATDYQIDISTADTFSTFVTENASTSGATSHDASGLDPDTTYHVRVRSVGSGGTSANSSTLSVTTLQAVTEHTYTVASGTTTVSTPLTGSGNLTKSGDGTLEISSPDNSYTGETRIDAGVLAITGSGLPGTGGVIYLGSGVNSSNAQLTLNGTQSSISNALQVNTSGGSGTRTIFKDGDTAQTLSGAITLNRDVAVQVATGSNLTFSGVIGGSAGLEKTGDGTLTFSGSSANTYSGATTVTSGTLVLAKSADVNALAGTPTVASGGVLRLGNDNQLAGDSTYLTVNGTFDLDGHNETAAITGSGSILLGSGTLTFNPGGTDTFSGGISGTGGIIKANSGTQVLSGNSSHSGATTISAGVLEIQHGSALGGTGGGTTVSSGAQLKVYHADGMAVGEPLTINGVHSDGTGAVRNVGGNNTLAGAVTLGSNARINATAGSLTISGAVSAGGFSLYAGGGNPIAFTGGISGTLTGGDGAVYIDNTSSTTFGAASSSLSGDVRFSGGNGSIVLGADSALGTGNLTFGYAADTAPVITSDGAAGRTLANSKTTIQNSKIHLGVASSGTGGITFGAVDLGGDASGEGHSRMVVAAAGSSHTFGVVGGGAANHLIKAGSGNLVLSSANTYAGSTRIEAGSLVVSGSGSLGASPDVFIKAGASLDILANTSVESIGENGAGDGGVIDIGTGVTLTVNGANEGTRYQNSISGQGGLTMSGSGTTVLSLYGTQSRTGTTTVTSGTLASGVSMSTSSVVLSGGTFSLTGAGSIPSADITLGGGATLDISGSDAGVSLGSGKTLTVTGGGAAGNITVASSKNYSFGSGSLVVESYSGGATAPLVVGGAGGSIDLNSRPISVTTSSELAAGNHTLIGKSGGATVTGTPGTLTLAGAGAAGTASLAVVGGELVLTVTVSTYAVTYDGNGNDGGAVPIDETAYASDATVTVAGNTGGLSKTGHTFAGWNTQADGGGTARAAASTFTITSNTTLHAQWTTNNHTLSYDGNGSDGGSVPTGSSGNYNTTLTVAAAGTMARSGHTFDGWNTASDGSGTAYAAGGTFTIPAMDTTLYAQWLVSSPPDKVILSRSINPSATGFRVVWTDVDLEGGYEVEHATSGDFAGSTLATGIPADATHHDLTGLTAGTTYHVRVRATNAAGNGAWSDPLVNQLQSLANNSTKYLSAAGKVDASTVAGIFGANNEAGLASGTTAIGSTTIMLLNDSGSTAHTIFYNSSANQWREGADDKGSTSIPEGTAFMLKNNNSGSTDYFLLAATPRTAPLTVSVNATAGQVNLLTPAKSVPVALNALDLTTGGNNTSTGIKQATLAREADVILIEDDSGRFKPYHYDGTNWKINRTIVNGTTVPMPSVPAGGAFFIRKAEGSEFNSWLPPVDD